MGLLLSSILSRKRSRLSTSQNKSSCSQQMETRREQVANSNNCLRSPSLANRLGDLQHILDIDLSEEEEQALQASLYSQDDTARADKTTTPVASTHTPTDDQERSYNDSLENIHHSVTYKYRTNMNGRDEAINRTETELSENYGNHSHDSAPSSTPFDVQCTPVAVSVHTVPATTRPRHADKELRRTDSSIPSQRGQRLGKWKCFLTRRLFFLRRYEISNDTSLQVVHALQKCMRMKQDEVVSRTTGR